MFHIFFPPFILLAILLIFLFEIWMFVDLLQNPRLVSEEKLFWAIGMILIHPIVAIVYYFVARKNKGY